VPTPRRSKNSPGLRGSRLPWWLALPLSLVGVAILAVGIYAIDLDREIRSRFEGARWELPARVYARNLELFEGAALDGRDLEQELKLLGYSRVAATPDGPGQYLAPSGDGRAASQGSGGQYRIWVRPHPGPEGQQPGGLIELLLRDGSVTRLRDGAGAPVAITTLDAVEIATILPGRGEDRLLIRLDQAPPQLVPMLLAVEDRAFLRHQGVDPFAVLRAILANLRAGDTVQGGSTLTQQLVKNLFLTRERSLKRKVNEALMALLLELRYSKQEILETYLNEVYLGQDGARAIHGFGLAAWHYFGRPLAELDTEQLALLVGLVKGPSYYDPYRQPERAEQRRDLVLGLFSGSGRLGTAELAELQARPLGVVPPGREGNRTRDYAAFLELLRAQLNRDYRDEDLRSQGLTVFTSLDPLLQRRAQRALLDELPRLERGRKLPEGTLDGAVVVLRAGDGAVLALAGGRTPVASGFNRALQARRPVGSALKPLVYLTAMQEPSRFHLGLPLDDSPLTLDLPGQAPWQPQNYDRKFHGQPRLIEALAHSYNLPAVRTGLEVGLPAIRQTLTQLGLDAVSVLVPASILGSVDLTPLELATLYQGVAADGFHSPPQAIRAVRDPGGQVLSRSAVAVRQAVDPRAAYLTRYALAQVFAMGTAASAAKDFPPGAPWGKTGTTDELRDAWFAGGIGGVVGVVWVGRDDNQPAGLTGGTGALPVWRRVFAGRGGASVIENEPEGIGWYWAAPDGYLRTDSCDGAMLLPFDLRAVPEARYCGTGPEVTREADTPADNAGFRWPSWLD